MMDELIDELDKEELRNILKSLVREMSEDDRDALEMEIRMGVYSPNCLDCEGLGLAEYGGDDADMEHADCDTCDGTGRKS